MNHFSQNRNASSHSSDDIHAKDAAHVLNKLTTFLLCFDRNDFKMRHTISSNTTVYSTSLNVYSNRNIREMSNVKNDFIFYTQIIIL